MKTLRKMQSRIRDSSEFYPSLSIESEYLMFCSKIAQKMMDQKISIEPCNLTVFGAVLFADISGFTRLSSRLSAEELKFHINEYFGLMLGIVSKFSGDAVKFCGDSVIIIWPISLDASQAEKAACVLLSSICALNLLSECDKYDRGEGELSVSLRLHCGIGCGTIHCMCLGEGDRWEFLVSGDPLTQAGHAESNAALGKALLSSDAAIFVDKILEVVETSVGLFELTKDMAREQKISVYDQPLENSTSSAADAMAGWRSSKIKSTSSFGQSIKNLRKMSGMIFIDLPVQKKSTKVNIDDLAKDLDLFNRDAVKNVIAFLANNTDTSNDVTTSDKTSSRSTSRGPGQGQGRRRSLNCDAVYSFRHLDTTDTSIKSKWMKCMSHQSVRDPIDNQNHLNISEIRHVVTMFIEIGGLEESFVTGSTNLPQKAFSIVLNVLQRFEGLLRQYVVDDKGCVMIAAFGVPKACHADNHVRAIETAISVRTLFYNIGCSCRVGITSGKVFCGLVGSTDRCEYAMMGSTVNLAARLMSSATYGEIIVSADVQLECSKSFSFRSLQPIRAKGYQHPITVYSPEERLKASLDATNSSMEKVKFVGRETELKTLLSSFNTMSGRGNTTESMLLTTTKWRFLISGVSGAGKSQLIAEFLDRLGSRCSPHVLRGRDMCLEASYSLIDRLLHSIFVSPNEKNSKGNNSNDNKPSLLGYIQQWIEKNAYDAAMQLPENNSLPDYDLDNPSSISYSNIVGTVGRTNTYLLLTLLPLLKKPLHCQAYHRNICPSLSHLKDFEITKICDQMIVTILDLFCSINIITPVFVVEQLSLCDIKSLEILSTFLSISKKYFFIGTSIAKSCMSSFREKISVLRSIIDDCETIALQPFSASEIKELLNHIIGPSLLLSHKDIFEESEIDSIIERTEGIPFLTTALILCLRDAFLTNTFTGLENLPSGENKIILHRYDKLSTGEKMILKIASAINGSFECQIIIDILSLMASKPFTSRVAQSLFQLEESNFLSRTDSSFPGSDCYSLTCYAVRECIYDLMLTSQKHALHSKIACLLEDELLITGNILTFESVLHHYRLSNNEPKMIQYTELGAFTALDRNDFSLALEYFGDLIMQVTTINVTSIMEKQTTNTKIMSPADNLALKNSKRDTGLHSKGSIHKHWCEVSDIPSNLTLAQQLSEESRASIFKNAEVLQALRNNSEQIAKIMRLYASPSMIDAEALYFWVGLMAMSHYMMGHFQAFHNFALLSLSGLNIRLNFVDDDDKYKMFKFNWYSMFQSRPHFLHQDTCTLIIDMLISLSQVFVLRGMKYRALCCISYASSLIDPVRSKDQYCELLSCKAMVLMATSQSREADTALLESKRLSQDCCLSAICANHIAHARVLAASGKFKVARAYAKKSMTCLYSSINNLSIQYAWISLERCSWLLLGGEADRCIAEIQRITISSTDESRLPLPITRWMLELNTVIAITSKDFTKAIELLDKSEEVTATSSVLKAMALVHTDVNGCFELIKDACKAMARKSVLNAMTSLYFFFGGYCSLQILAAFRESNDKEVTQQHVMIACAEHFMKKLNDASSCVPCCTVLLCTLQLMSLRIQHQSVPNRFVDKCLLEINNWGEYAVGLAYFHHELSFFYLSSAGIWIRKSTLLSPKVEVDK